MRWSLAITGKFLVGSNLFCLFTFSSKATWNFPLEWFPSSISHGAYFVHLLCPSLYCPNIMQILCLSTCLTRFSSCMFSHCLKLTRDKTEFILFWSSGFFHPLLSSSFDSRASNYPFSLPETFESCLITVDPFINCIAYFQSLGIFRFLVALLMLTSIASCLD